jgi:hypothetical protein
VRNSWPTAPVTPAIATIGPPSVFFAETCKAPRRLAGRAGAARADATRARRTGLALRPAIDALDARKAAIVTTDAVGVVGFRTGGCENSSSSTPALEKVGSSFVLVHAVTGEFTAAVKSLTRVSTRGRLEF